MREYQTDAPEVLFIWIAILVVAAICSIIYSVIRNKKLMEIIRKFQEENPNASKIYTQTKGLVTSQVVEIHLVDGMAPVRLMELGKNGILIAPGEHNIQVSSTYTRPGVMYRTVTTSTGTISKTIEIKPNMKYMIEFDRKQGEFSFKEAGEIEQHEAIQRM